MSQTALPSARFRTPFTLAAVGVVSAFAILGPLVYPVIAPSLRDFLRGNNKSTTTESNGGVPDRVTVFDDHYPAVSNLNPALLGALREAATDAAHDGVKFYVNSGWRSPEYQNQLLREAIAKYGSEREAARWVATAETSAHVSGDAIDIGPADATSWLSKHGAKYGLCQIYRNEPWHYELRPQAINGDCPVMYPDPTHDPRMQQERRSLPDSHF